MTFSSFTPITRALMRQRYRLLSDQIRSVPHPDDAAHGTAGAIKGYRVLIVGNEYAISWGVRTHALGLPGQLARELSLRTGTGADVDVISDPGMSITDLRDAVGRQKIGSYDWIVLITGAGDAYKMLPPVQWVVQLKDLLQTLTASGNESALVSVVGIQPASSVRVFHARADGTADRWAQALNEISEGLCLRHNRVHYMTSPDAESGDIDDTDRIRFKSPAIHKAWAVDLARHIIPLLSDPLEIAPEVKVEQDAVHRAAALDGLHLANPCFDDGFVAVVRRARSLFQTEGAAFSVLEGDHLVTRAVVGHAGPLPTVSQSFCATTITTRGPFVVEDSEHDARVTFDTPIRFYAGYPITAPDGTRIGALCVFDTHPRKDTTIDTNFLRELADDINMQLAEFAPPAAITA